MFNWSDTDSLFILKYFLEDTKALRLRIGITFNSDRFEEKVQAFDDDLIAIPNKLVTNTFISENFLMGIGAGIEHNFGYRRWRYFHGYEGFFSFETGRERIINGNPLPLYIGTRLDDKSGVIFNAKASILAGVEYFIQRNSTLGLEFGWGATYSINSAGEYIIVEENENGEAVEFLRKGDSSTSSFHIDNSLLANFKLTFYFNRP